MLVRGLTSATLPAPPMQRWRAVDGFTLVELLTVLSVLGVLAAVAVPGLGGFATGQQVKTLAYDLTSDLLLARSEALKRNASVQMTPLGATWASGWTLRTATENISTRNATHETLSFDAAPAVPTVIAFNSQGRVSAPNSPVRMTISAAGQTSGGSKRCLQIDLSGRVRTAIGACP